MFTGLVQDIGAITHIDKHGDWRISVQTGLDLSDAPRGASIMCSGVCLTVVERENDIFMAEVSHETLSKTNLGGWQVGTRINLERSLKMGDELGGHFVFGHVDGLAELVSITPDSDSYRLRFSIPDTYMPYVSQKGSIALDGISLTVNDVDDEARTFGVNIISHTWDHTTLCDRRAGDIVNFEVDMLARYVARMIEVGGAS